MSTGIVCKVWNISGNTKSKTIKSNLKDSVGYILNSEKVDAALPLDTLNQLNRECKYIENDLKTFNGALVGLHNLSTTNISTAVEQMMTTKEFYGKTGGRAALHLLISLPEDESDFNNAPKLMSLCEDVLKELFPDNQAIFAVHTNTDDLHIHVIINSVGLNGKKIHQPKNFVKGVLQPCVNKYAAIYGFKQNEKWNQTSDDKLSFTEMKIMLRNIIDIAIENSNSFEEFIAYLKEHDLIVNVGKNLSLKMPGMSKAIRSQHLGSNYSIPSIVDRITTRKDDFYKFSVGHYSISRPENIVAPNWHKLKRYKELNADEKAYVIRELKLGHNPWRENRLKNWQQNRIANHINASHRVDEYIKHYSKDHTIEGALNGIIEAKKKVAHEKKMVAFAKVKYKPILDIYNEMQIVMKKAFLYEYNDVKEYRKEFERYRELTRRLKDGYGKDVFEVAHFLNECDETLLYAQSELKELSEEYREVKQFGRENNLFEDEKTSLLNTVGFYNDFDSNGFANIGTESFYLSSLESDVIVRIDKSVAKNKYGDESQKYLVTLLDKYGKKIETFDNSEGARQFERKLENLQNTFRLKHCRKFTNINRAQEFIQKSRIFRNRNNTGDYAANKTENKNYVVNKVNKYSFAQAINHVNNESKMNVVINVTDPNYIAVSRVTDELLKIIILDQSNKPVESADIPIVEEKNNDGYKTIVALQEKYGFSDSVAEYNSVEEARQNTESRNNRYSI